ncbi:MAG: T9SS type A sorting domain-containing protein [Ignavibacteria bacterium]
MKLRVLFLIIILNSYSIFSQNWTTTGGNLQRNGICKITGPNSVAGTYWIVNSTNSTAWGNSIYSYNDKFVTSRIVLSPYTGKIELRNINTGALIWEKMINSSSRMYAVGFTEDAVYAHDYFTGILYALNISDGSVKWSIPSDMFPGNTGLLFACDGDPIDRGKRINKNTGAARWTNNYIIPVGPDGGFCIYGNTYYHWTGSIVTPKKLIAIDLTTGITKYTSADLAGDGDQENDLCIGPDGTIYICRDGGSLFAFRDNGTAFVQQWVHTPGYVVKGVGKDGTLYASNINDPSQFANSNVYRLDPANGNILDSAQTRTPLAYFACGADSTVYISTAETGNGRYVAFSPNLQIVKWSLSVPYNYYSGPSLSKDGIFITAGSGTEIKAYKTNYTIKPVADFKARSNQIFATDTVSFFDQSSFNPTSWLWLLPGSNTPSTTLQNPLNVLYSTAGTYPVTLIASNSFGTDTLIRTCYINVSPWFGIQQTGNELPEKFLLKQNYPNPFNPTTHFEFQIADFGFTYLTIFDASGRKVEVLVNEELASGTYEAEWDASRYSSGIYFYTLKSGNFKQTKKMLLIK